MPIHRLIEIFETGTLPFIKPSCWSDAFENYLSKVPFDLNGDIQYIYYLNDIYVSCWTKSSESDLFWRAYCPQKNGVYIMSTIDKFEKLKREHPNPDCFTLKNVTYNTYEELKNELENEDFLKSCFYKSNKIQLLSYLFKKRNEFSFEDEYRIVFDRNSWTDKKTDSLIFRVSINPMEFIHEIKFDPAMPDNLCEVYKQYFRGKGFTFKRKIRRSLLYKYKVKKVKL